MDTNKQLCLIQANCQADALQGLLMSSAAFNADFELRRYTNFLNEQVPDQELARCSCFIYQHLGPKWDTMASKRLLPKVNPNAKIIQIPNMLFKGYWPFWTSNSPSEFGDEFLDKLIAMQLSKPEIMHIYLHGNINKKFDLTDIFEKSIAIEREKEKNAIIKTVDYALENFKTKQLFYTINHPSTKLLAMVAKAIYYELGLELPPGFSDNFPNPYPELTMPIHPQVAAFHGISFANEHTKYNIFGKQKTFAEYVSNYIDSQLLNLTPLTAYLHMI